MLLLVLLLLAEEKDLICIGQLPAPHRKTVKGKGRVYYYRRIPRILTIQSVHGTAVL